MSSQARGADRCGAARALLLGLASLSVVAMAAPVIHVLAAPSLVEPCRLFGRALVITAPAFVPSGRLGRHPTLGHRGVSLRARPLIPQGAAAMDSLLFPPIEAPAAAAASSPAEP